MKMTATSVLRILCFEESEIPWTPGILVGNSGASPAAVVTGAASELSRIWKPPAYHQYYCYLWGYRVRWLSTNKNTVVG